MLLNSLPYSAKKQSLYQPFKASFGALCLNPALDIDKTKFEHELITSFTAYDAFAVPLSVWSIVKSTLYLVITFITS
ncbi:hypothetical protein [Spiroplasma tabanidicola]|uniref:Uncharacterized protein n=1 Tax=Spiroplasma tabanidicola TaxID=324079 RepID=A0A6I6C995_9MOLU|nr:hypothetical protein [Spiroplasma tabanidicola]QGS51471.1 hypothetical protein STABA_v1c01040 [Spiroplasma tabanidicola]